MTTQITIQVPGGAETDIDMDRVIYRTASFSMRVDGVAGEFFLQIRDPQHDETFVTGSIIRLYIDSIVRFGGFLLAATKTWPLLEDTTDPTAALRFWELKGTDWNILWTKQVVHDPAHTTTPYKMYAIGTHDDTILNDVLDNYTDIAEFCPTRSITRVGIVILDISANKADGGGAPWNQGSYLNEPFAAAKAATGAIYYINAAGVITYCDVETVNATLGLSDTPDSDTGTVGYRITKIAGMGDQLCNDALVWGAALGSSSIVFRRVEDSASIDAHGRWQKGLYSGGLYRSSSIDTVAGSMVYGTPSSLRGAKDDKVVMTCTVNDAPFSAGEKVRCQNHVWGFDMVLPVRKVTYLFPTPTNIVSELLLSYDVDVAWSIFEYAPFPTFRLPSFVFPTPPIFPPVGGGGGGGCTDAICGITDSFTRVVASGWGTSDAGFTWLGSSGTSSVDGASGLLSNGAKELDHGQLSSPYQAYFEFEVPSLSMNWVQLLTGDWAGFSANIGLNTVEVYANDDASVSFTWAINTRYAVRFYYIQAELRAKVWVVTDPEPSVWTVVAPQTTLVPFTDYFTSLSSVGGAAYFDNLDITDVTCCTAVQFDNFNRMVANGWGIATPSGVVWDNSTLGESVDGSRGIWTENYPAGALGGNRISLPFTPTMAVWNVQHVGPGTGTVDFYIGVGTVTVSMGSANVVLSTPDGGVSTPHGIDFTIPYSIRFLLGASSVSLRVWQGVEPSSWLLTNTITAPVYDQWELIARPSPTTFVVAIDSIDFDYAGKPCYIDCGVGSIIDDFSNRSFTINGPWAPGDTSFGASSGGQGTWEFVSGGLSQAPDFVSTEPYEAAYIGYFALAKKETSSPFNYSGFSWKLPYFSGALWDRNQYVMRYRFQSDSVGHPSVQNVTVPLWFGVGVLNLFIDDTYNASPLNGAISLVSASDSTSISKTNWVANAWYIAEVGVDLVAGTISARVFLDGMVPSGWDLTVPTTQTSPTEFGLDYLTIGAFNNTSTETLAVLFSSISIDPGDCEPVPPAPGNNVTSVDPSPSSVRVTNNINFVSGTPLVIYLPTAYLPGSVQMWFDGLLQTPVTDYTETDPVGDPGATPHGGNITLTALPYGATNPGGVAVTITITFVQNGPFAGTATWP